MKESSWMFIRMYALTSILLVLCGGLPVFMRIEGALPPMWAQFGLLCMVAFIWFDDFRKYQLTVNEEKSAEGKE